MILVFVDFCSVVNSSESGSAFFCAEKRQKAPQNFFKKAPQYQPKAPQFETFSIWHIVKMTHHTNFIAFLCDNIYQMSHSNIFPRFFKTCTGKILFWQIFLSAQKNLWRHKQSQKRHSGAKAPLLKALFDGKSFKFTSFFVLFTFRFEKKRVEIVSRSNGSAFQPIRARSVKVGQPNQLF